MHKYQSHKVVEAAKIKLIEEHWLSDIVLLTLEGGHTVQVGRAWMDKHEPEVGWYYVVYPDSDNYQSASPPEPFEAGNDLLQPSSGKSKIVGYRELTPDEIEMMNTVKAMGIELGALVETMRSMDLDQRWVSIGATDLQTGLMALTRSIAKPDFF